MYSDLNCYDNYVGNNIKLLRVFFNYLNEEKGLEVGSFHKSFHICKEEIQIIPLLPEQLNFLIYDKEFEKGLSVRLRKTKDIFVFGCTVGLRVSDLLNLTIANLEIINGSHYLRVLSQKSETLTRVLLPEYAIKIIHKDKRRKTLFPPIHYSNLDKNIKLLLESAGWTHLYIKTRSKRGIPMTVFKNEKTKEHFRFCDLVSSHTMRRTAITTMLCLGMPEHAVRKISGHSANSKEFFRYVELSQSFLDAETKKIYQKLENKKLIEIV